MAYLGSTLLSQSGSTSTGVDITLKSSVNFTQADRHLNLNYFAQALVYDEDYGSDILIPLIENLYCITKLNQFENVEGGSDDLIKKINFGVFKPSEGSKALEFTFNLQKAPTSDEILVSNDTVRALRDETRESPELELRGIIILTNELNGVAIGRSNMIKVDVLSQVLL